MGTELFCFFFPVNILNVSHSALLLDERILDETFNVILILFPIELHFFSFS